MMNMRVSASLPVCLLLMVAISPSFAQDSRQNSKVIVVPQAVMAARLNRFVAPELPNGVLKKRCSDALVMLGVTVDDNGKVSDVKFLSGYVELKDSAIAALKQWTYRPYEEHGHAVVIQTQVWIFYLGDGRSVPAYSPDGKGGVKGGNIIPLPDGCNSAPSIKRVPS